MGARRTRLSELSADELEDLVVHHTNGFFMEMKMATDKASENWSPAALARKHPMLTGGLAAGLGVLLIRALRGGSRDGGDSKPASSPSLIHAFLASALGGLGGLVPQLAMMFMARRQEQNAE